MDCFLVVWLRRGGSVERRERVQELGLLSLGLWKVDELEVVGRVGVSVVVVVVDFADGSAEGVAGGVGRLAPRGCCGR